MLDDRARKKLQHPSRQILRRAINGVLPDDEELRSLGLPEPLRDQVLEAAEVVSQLGSSGMRGKAQARLTAERLADAISEEAHGANNPHALPAADDYDADPADLAMRIEERMREGAAEHLDGTDRDALRLAAREATEQLRQGRRDA